MQETETSWVTKRAELSAAILKKHLQAAAFLVQRRPILLRKNLPWLSMAKEEDRFEAFMDGIFKGKCKSRDLCLKFLEKSSPQELQLAIRLFCRLDDLEPVKTGIIPLDLKNENIAYAVTEALKSEMPRSWGSLFLLPLLKQCPETMAMAAQIGCYQRIDLSEALLEAHGRITPNDSETIALTIALGRLRSTKSRDFLSKNLYSDNDPLCFESALAMLRAGMGQQTIEHLCFDGLDRHPWRCRILGLWGNGSKVPILIKTLAGSGNNELKNCCLISLGLLGDVTAMETLIEHLGKEEVRENASIALNLITGAGLMEDNQDRNTRPEQGRNKDQHDPINTAGHNGEKQKSGESTGKVAWETGRWKTWWSKNCHRFQKNVRYRNGFPNSPLELVKSLADPEAASQIRSLAHEELVIRYGLDVPFETDRTVRQQLNAIEQYNRLLKKCESFTPGKWYLSGRQMSSW